MARIDTASQVEALSPNPKLHMLDVTVLTAASCGRPIARHAVLRLLLKGQDMVCETSNDSLSGPLGAPGGCHRQRALSESRSWCGSAKTSTIPQPRSEDMSTLQTGLRPVGRPRNHGDKRHALSVWRTLLGLSNPRRQWTSWSPWRAPLSSVQPQIEGRGVGLRRVTEGVRKCVIVRATFSQPVLKCP